MENLLPADGSEADKRAFEFWGEGVLAWLNLMTHTRNKKDLFQQIFTDNEAGFIKLLVNAGFVG